MNISDGKDLARAREEYQALAARCVRRVVICAGTGCVANGALKVSAAMEAALAKAGLPVAVELQHEAAVPEGAVHLSPSGCQGFCQMGPLVTILPENLLYVKVQTGDVDEIVATSLLGGGVVERLLYRDPATGDRRRGQADIPFYALQRRTVLKDCGRLDPGDIREYIAHDGYAAACRAFTEMTAEAVCGAMTEAGLRGRGGGGFPTGRKWALARLEKAPRKFVICNGDEGDPGAFMDRSLMEGNPHAVLEGMMIAARAAGAGEMYVYVRLEYPLAVQRMRRAVAEAEAWGLLGDNVFGCGLSLKCQVMEGAGAFVCGEETALIASIEGRRGMPSPKPPFPAQAGLWGFPTVINNVETLATVPMIIREGAAAYRAVGTPGSPGTKTFALTGHVANTGLIEVPFGATLKDIVMRIGGGVTELDGTPSPNGFKAVQIGGPSGGCLTPEHADLALDYDSLRQVGAMVGSGGLVVMNHKTCMVSIAKFFMQFTQNESCGKCVLCREGTKQMLALLDDITEGRADATTLPLLESLARAVAKGSLCGLGKTAPSPVLSTLRLFRAEYEAHVLQKRCPAGQCRALASPEIVADACVGCTACVRKCPVDAIVGEKKKPHRIIVEKCIKCGACKAACKFNAVRGL
jgi:NADH-quinone oxidoreductase subunit F